MLIYTERNGERGGQSAAHKPASSSWLSGAQPSPDARLRLFCFPYAGGGALAYRTWTHDLPVGVDLCPVQLPGRESRLLEQPYTRISVLVQTLLDVLWPYFDRPFALFGHSLGSLIGFELARQLRQQRELSPAHLFVSGRRAPQLPDPDRRIHSLPEAEFVEELRRLGGTPEAVLQDADMLQLVLPVLRADFAMCETYAYAGWDPLDCPITALGGWQDPKARYDELAAWHEQTQAGFRLHMFPGDHFYLRSARDPLLQIVTHELAPLLCSVPKTYTYGHSGSHMAQTAAGLT
jgi:medium-chain acyl-[acyl-carrier-protein] hydrolase